VSWSEKGKVVAIDVKKKQLRPDLSFIFYNRYLVTFLLFFCSENNYSYKYKPS
jgi:hypothetical protein